MEGAELERHYRETLRVLGARGGMLGLIFEKAQNRIQDPAKLRRLIVELIGREDWSAMAADVKGDAYEGLLEKNAQDVKGGRGAVLHAARCHPGARRLLANNVIQLAGSTYRRLRVGDYRVLFTIET